MIKHILWTGAELIFELVCISAFICAGLIAAGFATGVIQ